MKPSCDQYKKSLLKPCQVNQQAFLRSAAQKEPILSHSTGTTFLERAPHPAYLEEHPPWRRHLVSLTTQGTELKDFSTTFPSLICHGRQEAQADMEQNLSSWFKKNLVPCLVRTELLCTCMCCTAGALFSFKQPIKAYFGT